MSKNLVSILCGILSILFFVACNSSFGASDSAKAVPQSSETKEEKEKNLPTGDTIYIIHFHPTVQCSCCINVGNYSKRGLEKYYSKLYKDGHIVFKECNIDEDSLMAKRYGIFGSALVFKKSIKEKEEFKEIESVWEFCEDEGKYLPDFKIELDRFMKESKGNEASIKEKTGKTIP